MAKVVSVKKKIPMARALAASGAIAIALLHGREARSDGARATTEAQAEEKKEQAGVRTLGTSGLEDEKDPTLRPVKAERRSSFAAGLSIGASVGSVAGFPNDPTKIGLARAYTDTGLGAGYGGRFWVGAALRDFLTFGLFFNTIGLDTGANVFLSGTVGLHTEIYPAYGLGGPFRDIGIAIETGTGLGVVRPKADDTKILIDGGLASAIGAGVFYEGVRLGGKLGMGPFVSYDYMFNTSIRGGALVLGWRTALYPVH